MIKDGHSDDIEHLQAIAKDFRGWGPVAEAEESQLYIEKYVKQLVSLEYSVNLSSFSTFLPPRLVDAAKNGRLVPFFGAGVSIAAGIPPWGGLLEQMGVSKEIAADPHLTEDPLTAAELLAHEKGSEELQDTLRSFVKKFTIPALVHYFLARLAQPLYITTNYDILFETAWKCIHKTAPIVVTSDGDLENDEIDRVAMMPLGDSPILLKLHGCASKSSEEMILTRRQYRRHYRSNKDLFKLARAIMESRHTMFMGFSHRDFEISRQVEDVIYSYELNRGSRASSNPAFYSLQFDMRERTPEIFAARGIVALQPPLSVDAPKEYDYRSAGLSKSLVDLLGAMDSEVHKRLDIDSELASFKDQMKNELQQALDILAKGERQLKSAAKQEDIGTQAILDHLLIELNKLDNLAGQGLYLLKKNGDIRACSLPQGLKDPRRTAKGVLAERFYVRQAKTYRKPFISDCDKSKFNGHGTFFICHPLGNGIYEGLLFAAAQVGAWSLPIKLASEFWARHREGAFILLDSNGIALLPPSPGAEPSGPINNDLSGVAIEPEEDSLNMGFPFEDLRRLSRRDRLISSIWRNVVPLAQDDDVRTFEPDLTMYSVVTELDPVRWKLALSVPYPRKLDALKG
jgi:hypothetical protein